MHYFDGLNFVVLFGFEFDMILISYLILDGIERKVLLFGVFRPPEGR